MTDLDIQNAVSECFDWLYPRQPCWSFEQDGIKYRVYMRYAEDPVKQGEFLKHLRATKKDMTTFELLTLDARAWCVAFLKTEGKWKEA